MDYDLRRRIETFADGNCSSEAFIQELATHCADAPDFIWDVLALIDQYHRRGKISAEFQRSVRELIERPALTHEQPPASGRQANPLPGSVLSLTKVSSVRAEAYSAEEPTPSASSRQANPLFGSVLSLTKVGSLRADADTAEEQTPPASGQQANPLPGSVLSLTKVSSLRAEADTAEEQTPLVSGRQANPPAGSVVAASSAISGLRTEPGAAQESTLQATQVDAPSTEARAQSSQPAHAPVWARDGKIILPAPKDHRLPAREAQAPVLNHSMVLPAQTASDAWAASLTELKIQVRLNRSEYSEAALDIPGLRRTSRSRSAQLALLAVLVCCVSASSAVYKLAIMPVAAPAPVSSPPLQAPSISLSSDSYIVYPGAKSALIEVDRAGDSSGDLSFAWWTKESGAKSGQDYRGSRPKTEHLAAGTNSMQWSIPIYANATRRHTELFSVFIGSPRGGAGIGATTRATVFIMSPN